MNKLDGLLKEYCPNGVEYKELSEIATVSRGGNFQKKDFSDTGVPCIHYGQIHTKFNLFVDKVITYISEENAHGQKMAKPNDLIMAVTSEDVNDVCKCVAWLGNEDVAVSGHTAIIHHNQDPKYLAYFFDSSLFFDQKKKLAHGTKVIEVTPSHLVSVKIPVPPLEVQREIVRVLDNFTLLTAELTAELQLRKKQYEYYRNNILSFDNIGEGRWIDLSELAEIGTGNSNTNEAVENGRYPFFVRSQTPLRKNEFEYDEIAIITAGDGVGVGKVFHYVDGKYSLHQRAYRIHPTNINVIPKYLFHYIQAYFYEYINKAGVHSSVSSIRKPMLEKFLIPVPTIKQQQKIINELDKFDYLLNSNTDGLTAEFEARKKQYEYYRDKLLSFKELEN